jgi:hypothetical protein
MPGTRPPVASALVKPGRRRGEQLSSLTVLDAARRGCNQPRAACVAARFTAAAPWRSAMWRILVARERNQRRWLLPIGRASRLVEPDRRRIGPRITRKTPPHKKNCPQSLFSLAQKS